MKAALKLKMDDYFDEEAFYLKVDAVAEESALKASSLKYDCPPPSWFMNDIANKVVKVVKEKIA